MRSNQAPDLHPAAVGYSAIRGLPSGRMRQYSEVEFTNGWPGANRYHRMFAGTGSIVESSTAPSYAVLDVLDAEGEVVQEFDVPTADAFTYVKRMLGLTVVSEDGKPTGLDQDTKASRPYPTRCVASKHIPTTGAACSVCGAAGMQHEDDHPGGANRG